VSYQEPGRPLVRLAVFEKAQLEMCLTTRFNFCLPANILPLFPADAGYSPRAHGLSHVLHNIESK
jgi:hypothetical protein